MKFQVKVHDNVIRTYEVEANSLEQALNVVRTRLINYEPGVIQTLEQVLETSTTGFPLQEQI